MFLSLKPTLKLNPSSNHRLASSLRKALHVLINEQKLLIVSPLLNQRRSHMPLRAAVANGQRLPPLTKNFSFVFHCKNTGWKNGFPHLSES